MDEEYGDSGVFALLLLGDAYLFVSQVGTFVVIWDRVGCEDRFNYP